MDLDVLLINEKLAGSVPITQSTNSHITLASAQVVIALFQSLYIGRVLLFENL